jgi:hypothetical protein
MRYDLRRVLGLFWVENGTVGFELVLESGLGTGIRRFCPTWTSVWAVKFGVAFSFFSFLPLARLPFDTRALGAKAPPPVLIVAS